MNYLAHLYLSGNSPEIMIGNFIGDYVKGKNYTKYQDDIKYGILLHRKIDYYTDSHPIVKQSKTYFVKKYHKYAGVITDIFYDHFLTKQWESYSSNPIKQHINNLYYHLLFNYTILPIRVKRFLPYFVIYNWMGSYSTIEGLEKVLDRMTVKTSLPNKTKYAIEELRKNYSQLTEEFNSFFPDLINYVLEDKIVNIT